MKPSTELENTIRKLKRDALLHRIAEVAQGDPGRWVPVGLLGQQMGLPYEDAISLADQLGEEGLVERGRGGRLDPPLGPRVHLLPQGVERTRDDLTPPG